MAYWVKFTRWTITLAWLRSYTDVLVLYTVSPDCAPIIITTTTSGCQQSLQLSFLLITYQYFVMHLLVSRPDRNGTLWDHQLMSSALSDTQWAHSNPWLMHLAFPLVSLSGMPCPFYPDNVCFVSSAGFGWLWFDSLGIVLFWFSVGRSCDNPCNFFGVTSNEVLRELTGH